MRLLLVLLLVATAHAEERAVDASVYGAVLGAVDRPLDEAEQEALQAQFDRFSDAMTALSEGKYGVAADGFQAVADETGWYEAAYNGALAQRSAGEWTAALPLCDAALTARPGDPAASFLKASVLLTVGRHQDAEAAAKAAVATARKNRDPLDTAVGLLNLGAAQRMLGRTDGSLASYKEAATLAQQLGRPGLVAAAHAGAGFTHGVLGQADQARASLQKARKSGGKDRGDDFAEVELALAGMSLAAGDATAAAATVDRVAKVEVDDETRQAQLLATLSGLQRELDRDTDATKSLDRAEALLAGSDLAVLRATLKANRAAWTLEDGDAAGAASALEQVVAELSQHQAPLTLAGARLRLAQARLELGAFTEAQAQLDALRASLDGTGARELRRQALLVQSEAKRRQDDLPGALDSLDAALALTPADGPIRGRLRAERVVLLAAIGRVDDAAAEAGAMSPAQRSGLPARTRARMELQLGHALAKAGRAAEGERRARAAVEAAKDPVDAELLEAARDLVVKALLAQERPDDAQAFLQAEGLGDDALSARVATSQHIARFNAGVDAYNNEQFAEAAAIFAEVEQVAGTERRLEAGKNRRSALLLAGQALADAGRDPSEPWTELAALPAMDGDDDATVKAAIALAGHRAASDPAAAAELARGAAEAAPGPLAGQAWTLAGDLLFESDIDGAEAAYQSALKAWGQSPGTLADRAAVHYNLGLLAWNTDRMDAAKQQWTAAKTLAEEAGRDDIAAQAAADLKDLD